MRRVMVLIAPRLFGDSYEWAVLAAGRHQMPFANQAAMLGGNLGVGVEDSLFIGPGDLTPSDAAQVHKIRGIVEALGHRSPHPRRPAQDPPRRDRAVSPAESTEVQHVAVTGGVLIGRSWTTLFLAASRPGAVPVPGRAAGRGGPSARRPR
jgi:hypothetical protein